MRFGVNFWKLRSHQVGQLHRLFMGISKMGSFHASDSPLFAGIEPLSSFEEGLGE